MEWYGNGMPGVGVIRTKIMVSFGNHKGFSIAGFLPEGPHCPSAFRSCIAHMSHLVVGAFLPLASSMRTREDKQKGLYCRQYHPCSKHRECLRGTATFF